MSPEYDREGDEATVKAEWVIVTETFIDNMLKGEISLRSLQANFVNAQERVLEKTNLSLTIGQYVDILFGKFGRLEEAKRAKLFAVLATNSLQLEVQN